jgi:glycerol-3-phosphate cytidylyltransferase
MLSPTSTPAVANRISRKRRSEEQPGDTEMNEILREIAVLNPRTLSYTQDAIQDGLDVGVLERSPVSEPSRERRSAGAQVVGYTAGVFDMLHVGHLRLLEQARAHCDRLVVGVTTDELCFRRKSKTPLISYEDRVAMLRGLRVVDEVVPQRQMDRLAAWDRIRFNVTFVGDDWRRSESWKAYEVLFAGLGMHVLYFPYTEHVSSTLLRQRLSKPAVAV